MTDDTLFQQLLSTAQSAAVEAANAVTETNFCGGASIKVSKKQPFGKWLLKNGGSDYGKIVHLSVPRATKSKYGQCMNQASAGARAMANVLKEAGVMCSVHEYVD